MDLYHRIYINNSINCYAITYVLLTINELCPLFQMDAPMT